VLSQRSQVSK